MRSINTTAVSSMQNKATHKVAPSHSGLLLRTPAFLEVGMWYTILRYKQYSIAQCSRLLFALVEMASLREPRTQTTSSSTTVRRFLRYLLLLRALQDPFRTLPFPQKKNSPKKLPCLLRFLSVSGAGNRQPALDGQQPHHHTKNAQTNR